MARKENLSLRNLSLDGFQYRKYEYKKYRSAREIKNYGAT